MQVRDVTRLLLRARRRYLNIASLGLDSATSDAESQSRTISCNANNMSPTHIDHTAEWAHHPKEDSGWALAHLSIRASLVTLSSCIAVLRQSATSVSASQVAAVKNYAIDLASILMTCVTLAVVCPRRQWSPLNDGVCLLTKTCQISLHLCALRRLRHHHGEDTVFFPAFRKAGVAFPEHDTSVEDDHTEVHRMCEQMSAQTKSLSTAGCDTGAAFDAIAKITADLAALLKPHFETEEGALFDEVRARMTPADLAAIEKPYVQTLPLKPTGVALFCAGPYKASMFLKNEEVPFVGRCILGFACWRWRWSVHAPLENAAAGKKVPPREWKWAGNGESKGFDELAASASATSSERP
jgi:Hemerythrin HHE cation binding domain